ncbi:MAG: hypothetical protein Q9210_005918 [Variospora velana]
MEEPTPCSLPAPFLGSTVPQVYSFFKDHLRKPEDSKERHNFAHFTFLAVDAECFRPPSPSAKSQDYTILVCCDAPDFHEGENLMRLKTLRLPLPDAVKYTYMLDSLQMTPSEVHKVVFEEPDAMISKMFPPANHIPVEPYTNDEHQRYKMATPGEARLRRRHGLRDMEEQRRQEIVGDRD